MNPSLQRACWGYLAGLWGIRVVSHVKNVTVLFHSVCECDRVYLGVAMPIFSVL